MQRPSSRDGAAALTEFDRVREVEARRRLGEGMPAAIDALKKKLAAH